MNKNLFNYKSFEEMIEKYNPFAFKKEDGEILLFSDYGKAYFEAMRRLYELFPKGVVDMPYFIAKVTGLPIRDAEREFYRMKPIVGDETVLLGFQRGVDYRDRNQSLRKIMQALHLITETKFNESFFLKACDLFNLYLEKENEKIKEES